VGCHQYTAARVSVILFPVAEDLPVLSKHQHLDLCFGSWLPTRVLVLKLNIT